MYKINHNETDKSGNVRKSSYGLAGYVLMEAQGGTLGNAVVRISEDIKCTDKSPTVRTARQVYTVNGQQREINIFKVRPVLFYKFKPTGQKRELSVDAMIIGDVAMLGLNPEMDGITVAEIRQKSPFDKTIVASFVNGNGKSMPPKESYKLLQYAAINSPFVEGSAELTRDTALKLLKKMKDA
jgi:hypothetical protein